MKRGLFWKCRNFARRDDGGVAMMFAFAAIPLLYFIGAAVDYNHLERDKSLLQSGADTAALSIASEVAAYYAANGSYPSSLAAYQTQANQTVRSQTGNFGSVSPSNLYVCPSQCSVTINGSAVTLQPGQVAVKATGSQTGIFGGSNSVAATSVAGTTSATQAPSSITFQFQYAKGAYYKIVKLWATPVGGTPLELVHWEYWPKNLAVVAVPPPAIDAILVAHSGFPTNPVDTGIGVVTTVWNAANISAVNATANQATSQITFNGKYDNLYMTMDVVDQQCPPGQAYISTTNAPSSANQTWYNTWYYNAGSVTETVGCETPPPGSNLTPLTTWSLHVTTDDTVPPSTTNSQFIFKNGIEQPANTTIGIASAFSCPSNPAPGQTATNYYAWESMDPTVGDRDFFYTVTSACSIGMWNGGKSKTATLVR